jgi:hypothetical protein
MNEYNSLREKTFLFFDDKSTNYYIARRLAEEVKLQFHGMKVGEIRMLSETIGVERET